MQNILIKDDLLAQAFAEQVRCMQAVYAQADEILRPMPGAPEAFDVRMGEIPASFFSPRRNVFSTLFQATYRALGVPPPRRLLYGEINHLFRIWVTGADNLLDAEDKCVLPLLMPRASRVMREVVAIMAADRVLGRLLAHAVAERALTPAQARRSRSPTPRCAACCRARRRRRRRRAGWSSGPIRPTCSRRSTSSRRDCSSTSPSRVSILSKPMSMPRRRRG